MSYDAGLVDLAAEAVASLGPPSMRRMMGGATLYCGGLAYAIVSADAIWFKADKESDVEWDVAAAADRFTYPRGEGVGMMSYRRAPDDCYDDPDAFRRWAMLALEAAGRAASKKTARRN